MRALCLALCAQLFVVCLSEAAPQRGGWYDVTRYGARPNDGRDDTRAIQRALDACAAAGGGTVYIPRGTYLIRRQRQESPILRIGSNTTLRGEGAASILKFDPKVNETNFWRMLGVPDDGAENIVIRDLHLDGSNTFQGYEPGKTPEHNHGIFLHATKGQVVNVTIRDCIVENFSGDCVNIGPGCRNVTIEGVVVRNFVRQGIQLAGGNGARGYRVVGCKELEGDFRPGGSTIHVEHARGLTDVIISGNLCLHSILASGVARMIIEGNVVHGRIEGNLNRDLIVRGNTVVATSGELPILQFGYADGLIVADNVIIGGSNKAAGVYVWGISRYRSEPSRNVLIRGNLFRTVRPAIRLNGVHHVLVANNLADSGPASVVAQRVKGLIRSELRHPGPAAE